ncbi:MAG: site-2 protease family protein [Deltaproteobacteria bacterium]|jgi:Zn-dependent protease|nr:site-2 protease family protein [Deltaproteobacteria bacterium]
MDLELIQKIILYAPPLLLAVMLHEIAHGWVAYKLGDPTAKNSGRLTLNPIKHVDPFMTIIFPGLLILANSPVIFGGAKPVPINPSYFKNIRKGMILVAFAGPGVNIILALLSFILFKNYGTFLQAGNYLATLTYGWLFLSIVINAVLALFNLFPILPLDGGRILTGILPRNLAIFFSKSEKFGLFLIFLLLYSGVLNSVLNPILKFIQNNLR